MNPFNLELNHSLLKMNEPRNHDNISDGINRKLHSPVNAHNQVIVENLGDGSLRRQRLAPRP